MLTIPVFMLGHHLKRYSVWQKQKDIGPAARQRAEQFWDPARVADLYSEVYMQAIEPGMLGLFATSSLGV